jgi:hypothetical protein
MQRKNNPADGKQVAVCSRQGSKSKTPTLREKREAWGTRKCEGRSKSRRDGGANAGEPGLKLTMVAGGFSRD